MNKLDQKDADGKDGKVERTRPAGVGNSVNSVRFTPGGPGWMSLHSGILWIGGTVLVVAAWIAYMIIDN